MSFRCTLCDVPQAAGIKPVRVTVAEREVFYENKVRKEDERGYGKIELVHSSGNEIMREADLCPTCANTPQPLETPLDMKLFHAIARGAHKHASGCEGITKRKVRGVSVVEPCQMCKRIMAEFAEMPSPALSSVLENPLGPPARFYLSTLLLDAMMRRTMHKPSGRVKRDLEAAYPLLKNFEARGGRV